MGPQNAQDAVEVIAAEREGKRQLATQLAALEARVSNDSGKRTAELDRLLSQVWCGTGLACTCTSHLPRDDQSCIVVHAGRQACPWHL